MRIFLTGGSGFIGTNLMRRLLKDGHAVRDYSGHEPRDTGLREFTTVGDILDGKALMEALVSFRPEVVMHLAARTDCVETVTVEEGYRANTEGTANFLEAVKAATTVRRAVIFSSQYVCGPGYQPKHDEDYAPVTVYGQSKVITEKLTRAAGLSCCWTLVRPTNIWGPWHSRYPQEFWRIAERGLYVHPGGKPVVRCYGYVGNLIHQLLRILELPEERVNGQVFYLSDPAGDIYEWASAFCEALNGRPARRVPRAVLRLAGLAGDVITAVTGKKFYITSSRYHSMTTDYVMDLTKTFEILGRGLYSLREGVAETVKWLRGEKGI